MEESTSNTNNSQSNKDNNDSSKYLKQAIDVFAETTNHIIDSVSWMANKLQSNGSIFKLEDARGLNAEVSLSIPPGETGEIVVILGQTRKHYPARAVDSSKEFRRGSKVVIKDIAVSTMYVDEVPVIRE